MSQVPTFKKPPTFYRRRPTLRSGRGRGGRRLYQPILESDAQMMKFLMEEAERGKKNPSPLDLQHSITAYHPSGHRMKRQWYPRPHLPSTKKNDFDSWGGRSGFSERILRHVITLEEMGVKPRHASLVVIPDSGMWRKMGNRSFLHKYGLYYVNQTTHPQSLTKGVQEGINDVSLGKAIDKAIGKAPENEPHKTRIFIKDGTYSMSTGLTLPTGKYLEGETENGTTLQLTSTSGASWVLQNANGASGANRCDLYNLTLDANNTASGGLHFQGAGSTLPQRYWNLSMRKLRITNFQGTGLELLDTANLFEGVEVTVDSIYNTANVAMHHDAPDSTFLIMVLESEYISLWVESASSTYWGDGYFGGSSSSAEQVLIQAAVYTNIHNTRNDFASAENYYIIDESGTATNQTTLMGGITSGASQASASTYPALRFDNSGTGTSNCVIDDAIFTVTGGEVQALSLIYATSSHLAVQLANCLIDSSEFSGPIIPASPTNFVKGVVAFRGNHLYNPVGHIASPWDTTNTACGITQGGTVTANPTASTTYTENGVDSIMYFSGGTLGSTKPVINGTTVTGWSTTGITTVHLSVADTINLGNFTGTITSVVYGK